MQSIVFALSSSLVFLAPLAAQQPPPAPVDAPAAVKQDKPKAEVAVYDEHADARHDVAAAVARARKENRRVLIEWGANWCGWCKWLAGTMQTNSAVARKLLYEYDVLHVDVGHFDKNLDLAKELGAEVKAIPFLTILDGDGKPVAQQNTEPFELKDGTKDHHDPQKLLAFLTEHQAKYLDAKEVRAAAFARAKAEGKRVFLHFGAPWCGWCHRLENWMAQPEIAALLAKDFVDVKIDQDRMIGGKEMTEAEVATAGVEAGGIPWFVFCDADGRQLANSNGPKGNVGFPYQPDEVAHFATMLEKARVKLTADEVKALVESLHAIRKADEQKKAQGVGQ